MTNKPSKNLDDRSYRSLNLSQIIRRLISLDPTLAPSLDYMSEEELFTAHKYVKSLLMSLPTHIDEVRRRTEPVSLLCVRVVIFTLVDQDRLTIEEADQLAPLLRVVGLGSLEGCLLFWFGQERSLLGSLELAEDEQVKLIIMRLERGLSMLFHSERGHQLFEDLSEDERVQLSGPWIRPMMRLAAHESFPRYALYALFKSTSLHMRAKLITQFERCRRKVRATPLPAYEKLLRELALDELDLLLAHLSSNGDLDKLSYELPHLPEYITIAYERMKGRSGKVS